VQHQPVWTSTKNVTDIVSEDQFLSAQNVFKRTESNAKMQRLDPADLDLKANFGANTCISLPSTFISKVFDAALDICDEGMDYELKHLLVRVTTDEVQVFAGTSSKLYVLKEPIDKSMNQNTPSPFEVCLDSSHVRIVSEFVSKAFGEGRCEIGAKLEDGNAAVCLLVACYAPEFEGGIGTDNPDKAMTKAAVFRLPRAVGDSPLAFMGAEQSEIDAAALRYTAMLSPRIKGLFVKQTEYVEMSHTNGLLEMCFPTSPEDNKPVRASLGCPLHSTGDLPTPGSPFVALGAKDFYNVMKYAKSPVTIDVWFNEDENGEVTPGNKIRLTNELFTVFLAQSYIVGILDASRYVTKKKGKVVISTQEEAVEKALKDNKVSKEQRTEIMKSFKDGESIDSVDEAPVDSDVGSPLEEALAEMEVATRANTVDPSKVWPPEKDDSDEDEDEEDSSGVDLDSVDDRGLLLMILDKLETIVAQTGPKSKPKKFDLDIEARNTCKNSTHDLLEYLRQIPHSSVKTAVLRQSLSSIRHTALHLALGRLHKANVMERLQKGFYYIPADIQERVLKYRNGVPLEAIEVPAEFIDKGVPNAGL